MSGQIFISYRREESRWSARSLHDRLCRDFDPKQIFMDIDAIPLGEDFVEAIETTVGKCDVLIAVIGKNWLISNDDQGNRRLDNPEDFVRMEIGAALKRKIRVIPVLLDGALMPRADELPEDLKPLVRRNALPITETSFEGDLHRLTGAITQALEKAEKERLEAAQRQREEKERLETERRQREKKERLEAAQRQREEKERLEAERRQREEKERLEAAQRQREKKERLEAAQRQREEKERLAPRALPLKALADMIKRTLRESSWRLVLALGFLAFVGIGSYALYRYLHVHTVPKVLFGELTVLSDPPGAAITLDEGPPLKAPHTFSDVKFGAHQLTATLKDFEPLSQTIEVRSGMNPEIHLPLTPGKEIAALSVQSEPPGASIFLDGKPPQRPPNTFVHVPFGNHELSATLKDFEPFSKTIEVSRGMTPEIHLPLTPAKEIPALSVQSEPPGASIFLDGKPPQRPPDTFTQVPFGAHELIVALNKYQPIKRNIDVHPGMTRKIDIELTPSPPDDIEWISSLDPGRLEAANKEFTETLGIYHELADKYPEAYRPNVAMTLNNLAILDSRQGRMEEARQGFAEALGIFRELTQKNQEVYWPLVATTLNNLADADLNQGRLEEARKEFVEALQIRRQLAQKNPDTYAPFVAKTLNNLAILDLRQNRIEEARSEFEEALRTCRGLAQKNQEIHAPLVAMTLNNLGNLALDQRRLEDARKEFAEALQIRRELAQRNPEVYRPYAAATLNNLAITDSHLNRFEDARNEFAEALDIYRKLEQKNQATYRPFIATTLNCLGDIDVHQGRGEEARKEFAEALQIYETLASQDPEQFTPKAAHLKKLLEQLSDNDENSGRVKKHR